MRLLSPRERPIEPARIDLHQYFSDAEIERGSRFARPQMALAMAARRIELGSLALRRAPAAPVALEAGPSGRRPGGAATAAGLAVGLSLPPLAPAGDRPQARDARSGWSRSPGAGWAADLLKGGAIEAVLAAGAGAAAVAVTRRYPRALVAAGVGRLGGVRRRRWPRSRRSCSTPCSTTSRRLPEGETRSDVLELARGGRGEGGGGVLGRRQPPDHGGQRVRGRARADQAGRAVRHPARPLQPRRGPRGRGARAWPTCATAT